MATQSKTFGKAEFGFPLPEKLVELEKQFQFAPQLRTDGISSFTREIKMARNALVRVYDVVVHAKRASATAVETVAQVRSTPASGAIKATIVLDFGTPRTISGVQVQKGLAISAITPWLGTSFAPSSLPTEEKSANGTIVILRKEIRTERLLVEVSGTPLSASDQLWADMAVVLPEAPSDLEIRIDGGPPVASFPGPAQPGPDSLITVDDWNRDGNRIVHLTEALGKLTGDPTNFEVATFKVVLSSRVPGELNMEELSLAVKPEQVGPGIKPGSPQLSYIRRMIFDGEATKELVFAEEGLQEIDLKGLPDDPVIEEIRFTMAATLPPERIIPPVGPGKIELADLMLNPDHAFCVRLRPSTGLAELTGVRLPLLAGSSGAEMRVVLWRPGDTSSEPFEAMPNAVSEPVTLDGAATIEAWTTFGFKRPVPIEDENPPWAALLVSRGEVMWSLGAITEPNDPIKDNVLRRGAPTGPWKLMPIPFQTPPVAADASAVAGQAQLSSARGRIRAIGHAAKNESVAPLIVSIGPPRQSLEVTPTAKGAAFSRSFSPTVTDPVLRVVSLVPGDITLRDLDVVTTK